MKRIKEFSDWMKTNTGLGDNSIQKYSRGVNTVSNDMFRQGVISKSLLDMSLVELDYAMERIMLSEFFINKNKTGNNMYSNSLKQYRFFLKDKDDYMSYSDIEKEVYDASSLTKTEKEAIISSRLGQGVYRTNLLKKYENQCIVTGINNPRVLIASHIKPWSISRNDERLDIENGLLLSANMDRLFDNGLLSFRKDGRILISSLVGNYNEDKLNISYDMYVELKASTRLHNYLEYHRDVIFVK